MKKDFVYAGLWFYEWFPASSYYLIDTYSMKLDWLVLSNNAKLRDLVLRGRSSRIENIEEKESERICAQTSNFRAAEWPWSV